ncbi:MAG: BamA/TamA family outer membrane protein [Gammaproteobacteria bacterium]
MIFRVGAERSSRRSVHKVHDCGENREGNNPENSAVKGIYAEFTAKNVATKLRQVLVLSMVQTLIKLILLLIFFNYPISAIAKTKYLIKTTLIAQLPHKTTTWLNEILLDSEIDSLKYANEEELNLKIDEVNQLLLKGLYAKGYYAAHLKYETLPQKKSRQIDVIFRVFPGEPYLLTKLDIEAESSDTQLPNDASLNLKINRVLEAEQVLVAQKILEKKLEKLNCMTSIDTTYEAIIEDHVPTVTLLFKVKAAPQAKFGPITFIGLSSVHESILRNKIKWQQGDCFKLSLIEKTRGALLSTKLFGRVDIKFDEKPNKAGEVPITIELMERLHRTVKLGAGYGTDEGIGGSTSWEHRNYFGEGEILKIDLSANSLKKKWDTTYTEPYFLRDDQSLIMTSKVLKENVDAYDALSWKITGTVQRKLKNLWVASAGIGYTVSRVEKANEEDENFGLLRLPIGLTQDTRDNKLDPTKGHQMIIEWIPYFNTFDTNISFYKTAIEGIKYIGFNEAKYYPVIATRALLGSITGVSLLEIPADERVYAGGGGSVRGYGYQKLSRFSFGEPLGGRSLLVLSSELRLHLSDKFGTAFFIDGGNTFEEKIPNFEDPLRWAVGAGIRYYTGFGPIRFDIAFPISRRPRIDSRYQFYISLGQAY